ncbi:unnamed protein product [Penicillium salamii]|nr:unnamed protein product [Penicillium salamii]CAG8353173.1 unnamed protein product [Penicillium salamii]CAG8414273.1 unnamed protein product [Penicillium salamii]CAG8879310.1 unnamed protein product [Penicillium salamii]
MSSRADATALALRMLENNEMKIKSHDLKSPINTTNERPLRNIDELNFLHSGTKPGSISMLPLQNLSFCTPNSDEDEVGAMIPNKAGYLHKPTGMHFLTPLCLSSPLQSVSQHPLSSGLELSHRQFVANEVHGISPFIQRASFAPRAFKYRDSEYDVVDDDFADSSSFGQMPVETASSITTPTDFSPSLDGDISYASGESFRFEVCLRAPTAMVKDWKEVPVTYLNKGQTYNLLIRDSRSPMTTCEPLRYRTIIRVCFDEEEQRAKSSTCWQLWKEGRGSNEAHQRGGKLLAVEYVNTLQGGESDKRRQVQVESTSVDGFCVTWAPNIATGTSECNIPVRFNFLSTDFSHSKGIKGIPVRLCAKTEPFSPGNGSGTTRDMELSYCRVKLFRDHGAERKLSNDIAHVKKTVNKLERQASQAEVSGGLGKRKRGNNASATAEGFDRSVKLSGNKRIMSIGPEDATDNLSLLSKMTMTQGMLSSTRSVSAFGLRGDDADDPDLHPTLLPVDGESINFKKANLQTTDNLQSGESMIPSPPNTHASSNSPPGNTTELTKRLTTIQNFPYSDQVARGPLKTVGIDPNYTPPSERTPRPVACFYVRLSGVEKGTEHHPPDYYRAIYLSERTAHDLIKEISMKYHIDPRRVARIMHINEKGMYVMVDDDVVSELPESQDMILEIHGAPGSDDSQPGTPESPIEICLIFKHSA